MHEDLLRAAEAAFRRGEFDTALSLLEQQCAAHGSAEEWLTLGRLQRHLGRNGEAHEAFKQAYTQQAANAEVVREYVQSLLVFAEQPDQAFAVLQGACNTAPADTELSTDLAILCEQRGEHKRALSLYDEVLEQVPGALRARLNRAAMARERGAFEIALADYDALIAHHPAHIAGPRGRAECLRQLHRYYDCIAACETVLADHPDSSDLVLCKAIACSALGNYELAQSLFDACWQRDADAVRRYIGTAGTLEQAPNARAVFILSVYQRVRDGDWCDYVELMAECEALMTDPQAALCELDLAHPVLYLEVSERARSALHRALARHIAAAAPRTAVPVRAVRGRDERVRLAYLTSSLREHPVAYLLGGVYAAHDRERFEVYGYALNRDDGSNTRSRLVKDFDHFRMCDEDSDAEVVQRIGHDEIDILIDVDGFADGARPHILATRPAPLQVAYLGHLHSAFAPWLDYRLSCRDNEPDEWGLPLIEKRAFLNESFFAFDTRGLWPLPATSRAAQGLPASGALICAFARADKLTPRVFAAWLEILTRTPHAILWLNEYPDGLKRRLRAMSQRSGVDPERLYFAPRVLRQAHLARLALADIYLDTLPFNAHTTALDAFHVGVPMVSCRGQSWAGRQSASFLSALGLDELIAASIEDYTDLACELLGQAERLAALSRRLQQRLHDNNPFASETVARRLEAAYLRMLERHRGGLPAVDLS